MFKRVLIANRGAIACRIAATLRKLGVEPIAVYSDADAGALHVRCAAEAIRIGPAAPTESYLNIHRILEAAHTSGAEAIHPGYGFLSENAEFAEACETAGLVFLGPAPVQIRAFGLKNTARDLAVESQTPILPGTGLLRNVQHAVEEAERIGYPVMLKSAGGGGGIGMRQCNSPHELHAAYESVQRLSETHFRGSGLFLEKFIPRARHIEVQVFGDGHGEVIHLGERDCSAQRRNQKVIEETPAPHLREEVRQELHATAIRLMQSVRYRSAGTVEFLYDADSERFYFLEVNSRLQVEHGVTEEVWGVDLVAWMVQLGAGELPPLHRLPRGPSGAAMQARLYAENPLENFQPSSGTVTGLATPQGVRFDTAIELGSSVTPYYDPLLAKLIVKAEDRTSAVAALSAALTATEIDGIDTNLEFLRSVAQHPAFLAGTVTTSFLASFHYAAAKVKVLEPGVLTTLQQFPGRLGFWNVGVPPSGPMDALAFQLANRLLGNPIDAPALECTMSGPTLRFLAGARVVLTGADMRAQMNAEPVSPYTPFEATPGDVLALGGIEGAGARTYIAVAGGFHAPLYLGSSATFTLGNFGGLTGRALIAGDYLTLHSPVAVPTRGSALGSAQGPVAHGHSVKKPGGPSGGAPDPGPVVREFLRTLPQLTSEWTIGALYGPHGAPDFLTEADISTFFATSWKVHHNSSRTGVRLIGPKPAWARADGGDAGLHPSNLHDNAYAIGAIDFTGDMPVILGPDGPSLGGFVCPAVVADAELWKIGQLRSGDTVRFRRITNADALQLSRELDRYLAGDAPALPALPTISEEEPAILRHWSTSTAVARASGDRYLLIEFGQPVLDLELRFRVHALMQALAGSAGDGIIDLTPGIRSLQVHYDPSRLKRDRLLERIESRLLSLKVDDQVAIPSRIVHLPLSWDDPATRLAIDRYMSSVRADAPWCPSNIEFIRRINGLASIDEVRRIVFDANYLVLGLGDVYLGAPVATPVDPRHRLVTTKYNPARTWTPENAVGIGGAYLCVYGMEGPGGYQFVGRTLQMWNRYRTTEEFRPGHPWLLRFFDQLRFYPVAAEELLEMREQFPLGRIRLKIEPTEFRLENYHRFLRSIHQEAAAFRARQQDAFNDERRRWAERGEFSTTLVDEETSSAPAEAAIPAGCLPLRAPATASVWQMQVGKGAELRQGQPVLILEAMKMEIAVHAPQNGEVVEVLCQPGALVAAGQTLLLYRPTDEPAHL